MKFSMIFFFIYLGISPRMFFSDIKRPIDFSFKLISETDSYDSKTGIYKRRYSNFDSIMNAGWAAIDSTLIDHSYTKGDSSIKVGLTESDWQLIYDSFLKSDFMNFPRDFECAKDADESLPAFVTTLEFTCRGVTKKVTNSSYCDKKIKQKQADKFGQLYSILHDIIINKPQIKKMKDSDLLFL